MSETTVLKGNKSGGLLDLLVNKGTLPDVNVSITKETSIHLGVMLVLSFTILILINYILKHLLK